MIVWIFIVTLAMPSFGGPVQVEFTMKDEVSCQKMRKVVVQQMESMRSNAILGDCKAKAVAP